jgi:Fe-Mn family superoxide dismutase
MTPSGSNKISACLMDAIKHDFGSLEKLQEAFSKVAVGQFGSGWAWLVHDPHDDVLKVMSTLNGENPMQSMQIFLVIMIRWPASYSYL